MARGPVVIGHDGSPASEAAIRAVGNLLPGQPALVVVVYKPELGLGVMELPAAPLGYPPVIFDVRTQQKIAEDEKERAMRLAHQGAEIAREAGLEASATAIAEEPGVSVSETLVRVAEERDARALSVGMHDHGPVERLLLGRTTRDVVRHASCPVVVTRGSDRADRPERAREAEHAGAR